MFQQWFHTRIGHMRRCLQQRFPLAIHYLFLRDLHRVSVWVALVVLVPTSLYYGVMHHVLPLILRDFLTKSPEEQHAILAQLDALTMPPWETLVTTALALALPLLVTFFLVRLTQSDARLSHHDPSLTHPR
jgi:hypothetical protein